MSILENILAAILNATHQTGASPTQTGPAPSAPPAANVRNIPRPAPTPTPAAGSPAPAAQSPAPMSEVDVDHVLTRLAEGETQRLDWRHSIVDLLKLLNLDPTLDHRRQLAHELGYTGDPNNTAEMNTWLHHAVIVLLEEHGGTVSDELKNPRG